VVGITTLIATIAGITYGVISNYETTKNLTTIVEETSNRIGFNFKGPYPL
jgi:hypothetical protein